MTSAPPDSAIAPPAVNTTCAGRAARARQSRGADPAGAAGPLPDNVTPLATVTPMSPPLPGPAVELAICAPPSTVRVLALTVTEPPGPDCRPVAEAAIWVLASPMPSSTSAPGVVTVTEPPAPGPGCRADDFSAAGEGDLPRVHCDRSRNSCRSSNGLRSDPGSGSIERQEATDIDGDGAAVSGARRKVHKRSERAGYRTAVDYRERTGLDAHIAGIAGAARQGIRHNAGRDDIGIGSRPVDREQAIDRRRNSSALSTGKSTARDLADMIDGQGPCLD